MMTKRAILTERPERLRRRGDRLGRGVREVKLGVDFIVYEFNLIGY